MSDEIEHDKPDAITRLRAENERLRVALRTAAKDLESHGGYVQASIAYAEAEENNE